VVLVAAGPVGAQLGRSPMDDAMNCSCADVEGDMEGSWANIVLAVVLIMLSGLFSGLNLGLMSLTEDDLRLIINGSDTPTEVRHASG